MSDLKNPNRSLLSSFGITDGDPIHKIANLLYRAFGLNKMVSATTDVTGGIDYFAGDNVSHVGSLDTVVWFGDSRIAWATPDSHTWYKDATSFATWTEASFSGQVVTLKNAGVPGNTTAMMQARIASDVLAYNAHHVVISAGVNDILGTTDTAEQIEARMETMIRQIIANGSMCHVVTTFPCGASYATWTAALSAKLVRLNRLLRLFCAGNPRCNFIDGYSIFVDSTTANGDAKPAYISADYLHAAVIGAKALGEYVAAGMAPYIRPSSNSPLISSQIDCVGSDAASQQLFDYGLMQGATGTGGVGGNVPTGWAATSTGGAVITETAGESRSDGIGNNATLTGTFAASGTLRLGASIATARFSKPGTYRLMASAGLSSQSGVTGVEFALIVTMDGVNYSSYAPAISMTAYPQTDWSKVLVCRDVVLPAGTSVTGAIIMYRVTGASGGAKLSLGRVSVTRIA